MREITEREKALVIDGVPETNLRLFYPGLHGLGGSLLDRSVNAKHGTLAGASWARRPRGTRLLSFDGINDLVKTADSLTILAFGVGDFTMLAWCYFDAVNIGTAQTVVRGADAQVVALGNWGGIFEEAGSLTAHGRTNAGAIKFAGNAIVGATWYHVALVRNTQTVYGYLNGVAMTTPSSAGANYNIGNSTLSLGASNDNVAYPATGYTSWAAGKIGSIEVYNRALTAAQVLRRYNRSRLLMGV